MTRPIRLEFGGSLYHVTARGDRREVIYEDAADRQQFLSLQGGVVAAFNWHCHAYCLMGNHHSYREISEHFGVHLTTVGRAVRQRGEAMWRMHLCNDEKIVPEPLT